MNISTRMTLSLGTAALVTLSLYGVWQVRAERQDLDASIEREVRVMGRSLQVAVENALRDRQLQDITETLAGLEGVDPNVAIHVYDLDGVTSVSTPGHRATQPLLAALAPAQGEGAPAYRVESSSGVQRALLVVPLRSDDGKLLGRMLVVRPMDDQERDLARTIRDVFTSVLVLVVLVAAVQFALGRRYITRPMGTLAVAMRNVRMDNMSVQNVPAGEDEVGMLAAEFNGMLGELRAARQLLAAQAEERHQAERHLHEVNKMATLGQLSAGLAHEIGSPLQIINGRARQLLSAHQDEALVKRTAQIVVDQSERITRTVENLLRFTRKTRRRKEPTSLEKAAAAVVEFLEVEARRNGVGVTLHAEPGLPLVMADADQIQQVVLNLLSNALHASPRGGHILLHLGRVSVTRTGTHVALPAIRLSVQDQGPGIEPGVRDRLFEPFFTTRADEGGTGLGLAVVSAIVQDHGAHISVESQPGKGALFMIDFPLEPDSPGGPV
jgi:signal transduction histidine kinase